MSVRWSAAGTRALRAIQQRQGENALSKRALGDAVRQSVWHALQDATLLQPNLQSEIKKVGSHSWFVEVSFVNDAAICALNSDYRGKEKPTDVLSFSLWEGDDVFPVMPGAPQISLGDVVISIETAARQAAELKHDLRAEVAFLAVHGALHLLGYDHGTDSRRRKMFALQDEIVARAREAKGF